MIQDLASVIFNTSSRHDTGPRVGNNTSSRMIQDLASVIILQADMIQDLTLVITFQADGLQYIQSVIH